MSKRCEATTTKGRRCKFPAAEGSTVCHRHARQARKRVHNPNDIAEALAQAEAMEVPPLELLDRIRRGEFRQRVITGGNGEFVEVPPSIHDRLRAAEIMLKHAAPTAEPHNVSCARARIALAQVVNPTRDNAADRAIIDAHESTPGFDRASVLDWLRDVKAGRITTKRAASGSGVTVEIGPSAAEVMRATQLLMHHDADPDDEGEGLVVVVQELWGGTEADARDRLTAEKTA